MIFLRFDVPSRIGPAYPGARVAGIDLTFWKWDLQYIIIFTIDTYKYTVKSTGTDKAVGDAPRVASQHAATSNTPRVASQHAVTPSDVFGAPMMHLPVWPIARPQLIIYNERIDRPELRQAFAWYIQKLQGSEGLPVLPPLHSVRDANRWIL